MLNPLITGTGAAIAAALLGVGWQLLTRHGVTTTLGPLDLAWLRYGIPALVLLPLVWRVGLRPRGVPGWRLAVLVAGGGLPFGLLVVGGAQFAPAAHMGVFMAGTIPVFTAVACRLLLGEPVPPARWCGLALICIGVGWLGASAWSQGLSTWRGDLLFILAALAWTAYTLAFRGCGLSPWQAAAVINAWSCLGLLVLLPLAWVHSGMPRLFTAPWQDVAIQALGQGVLAGLMGIIAYMAAVARLGSARAALSSALVPPLTALGAAWLLGEPAGAQTWAAVAHVAASIVLASGAMRWPGR